MTGAGSSSCGACKFLRRKCTSECVFVPYFSYDEAASHFAAVHKVFGASNVSKLLMHIPVNHRTEAAFTISYEALARLTDPVFGCVSQIYNLHQQIAKLQEEIEVLGSQVAAGHTAFPCHVSHPQPMTESESTEEGFNVAQMMNASGGYGVTDQIFSVTCGLDGNNYSVPGMEIMNEGLINHDAGKVFCPALEDSDSLLSYQSVQQHWVGEAQFQF